MRKIILALQILIACYSFIPTHAQSNHDYVWIMGYPPNKPEKYFGGVMLDFKENIASPKYFNTICSASQAALLADHIGNLKIYSNGCNIYNTEHEIIADGDSISYGYIWDNYCDYGYPGTQNQLLLPWPGDTSKAILLHKKVSDDFLTHYLMYTVISFTQEYPSGIVTLKDQLLVDPGSSALITATRHANGRDWWLILPEDQTNRFFTFLLDAKGITTKDTQSIGTPWGPREWASQAVFSPDGTRYIRFNPWKGLDIFDFDRCTGGLSNPLESGVFSDTLDFSGGVALSRDSRYLYISNSKELYQFDLMEEDILDSRLLIGVYDGYINPFPTNFYQMTLAPDGKIYIFSSNGVKSLHIIHEPQHGGELCRLEQHGMELPAKAHIGSINIPYFRLGPLDGSSCDTLGINNVPVADFRYEVDSLFPLRVRFRDLSYYLPETFHWDFTSSMTSEFSGPHEINFSGPGTYKVCLSVSNVYGQDSFCRMVTLTDSITSTSALVDFSDIIIHPNPFNDQIYIQTPAGHGPYVFQLFSPIGALIHSQLLVDEISSIDAAHWPSGVYFYSIRSQSGKLTSGKVVKN